MEDRLKFKRLPVAALASSVRTRKRKAPPVFQHDYRCPTCKEMAVVEDFRNGNLVCTRCCIVMQTHTFDMVSERAVFVKTGGMDVPAYQPTNSILGDLDVGTTFERTKNSARLQRTANRASRRKIDLVKCIRQIEELGEKMNLAKDLRRRAQEIYKILWESRKLKGFKKETYHAACVLLSCQLCRAQRSMKEIVLSTRIHGRTIGRCLAQVKKNLQQLLRKAKKSGKGKKTVTFDLATLLQILGQESNGKRAASSFNGPSVPMAVRFANLLHLPARLVSVIDHVHQKVKLHGLISGRTSTIAAVIVFMVSTEDRANSPTASTSRVGLTPDSISEIAGVSARTILSKYRTLRRDAQWGKTKATIFPTGWDSRKKRRG